MTHAVEPLLMHNTMRITDGHLDDFKTAIRRSVQFVEQHGPQLMVQVFIDEPAMLAHSLGRGAAPDCRSARRLLPNQLMLAPVRDRTITPEREGTPWQST